MDSAYILGTIQNCSSTAPLFLLGTLYGVPAEGAIPKSISDSGEGADGLSNLLARLSIYETGAGSEAVQKTIQKIYKLLEDAGFGADLLNILARIELDDSAAGDEIITGPPIVKVSIELKSNIASSIILVSKVSDKEGYESELAPTIIVRR